MGWPQEPVSPDREALVELYNATDGENWSVSTNWLTDEPIGSWYGVTTNDEGRVTRIDIDNKGLSGPLPPAIGRLSALEYLRLDSAFSSSAAAATQLAARMSAAMRF